MFVYMKVKCGTNKNVSLQSETQLMQLSNESLNKFTLARIQSLTPAVLVQRSSQFSQQASCNWEQSLDWFVIFQRSPHQKNP